MMPQWEGPPRKNTIELLGQRNLLMNLHPR